jgi:hypothetical protein
MADPVRGGNGGLSAQKHSLAVTPRTTAAEVGQDRFPNGGHERNVDGASSLERREGEFVAPPGDVLQGKQGDLLGAHAVGEQKLQDRVVALRLSTGGHGADARA